MIMKSYDRHKNCTLQSIPGMLPFLVHFLSGRQAVLDLTAVNHMF